MASIALGEEFYLGGWVLSFLLNYHLWNLLFIY
jgi:hypothetical protein